MSKKIQLRNVRVNNLQGIDLDIPHGQWIAFCGLSGSGKSSLAFDTLYAEGQRRYLECLALSTRQFISQLDKPVADRIYDIPPAIAVKAFRGKIGPQATVGTATEITEYLRLLFARIGQPFCEKCQRPIRRHDPQSVAASIADLDNDTRFQVSFRADAEQEFAEALLSAKRNGFSRAIVGATSVELANPNSNQLTAFDQIQPIRIVVDRLKGNSDLSRIRESLELAFQFGGGQCEILADRATSFLPDPIQIDGRDWWSATFSRQLQCSGCLRILPTPEPGLFSFTNARGACESCSGVGQADGAPGKPCPACQGWRLNPDALSFRIGDRNIAQWTEQKIDDASDVLDSLVLTPAESTVAQSICPKIVSRLKYLEKVGLSYLTLDRTLRSLSIGEAQRVSLTSCLSSTLVNMLYVLDEPSVGLHVHDIDGLVSALGELHARGNTVAIVDHDERMICAAGRVVEVGPEAGAAGGEIVFDGTVGELLESEGSLTGDFLAGRRGVSSGGENRRSPRGKLKLTGASGHNLKNLDVEFPLGCLCVVTGVSGSGKSSLVQETLYGAVCQRKEKSCEPPLPYRDVFGDSQFDEVVLVDQSPIGRSARSNPVTYVKAFDDIRRTYADTIDAKTHNIKVSQFSFNVAGGRCDKCEGAGQLSVDMQFLSDIHVICDQCRGTRYRDEILAVKYRGKSIADTLNLTVREAFSFFRGQPKVQAKLKSLIDVGLDYIRLGQPATTLSSGEAQRLKLGHYLNASKSKRALFLLDEPTTGLHMRDVVRLVDCFDALLSVGHSLIVVAHNLNLIKNADAIIDLGPGPAEAGGQIVATGTPEEVAKCEASVTGQYLRTELEKG